MLQSVQNGQAQKGDTGTDAAAENDALTSLNRIVAGSVKKHCGCSAHHKKLLNNLHNGQCADFSCGGEIAGHHTA